MLRYINNIFSSFENALPTKRMFGCFVMGMILRSDVAGLTSIVRVFPFTPAAYNALDYFFRNKSIVVDNIAVFILGIAALIKINSN